MIKQVLPIDIIFQNIISAVFFLVRLDNFLRKMRKNNHIIV